jgi:hypothetical protein
VCEVVTLRDCREVGYCAKGVFEWLERHGIDRHRLLTGVPVAEVEDIDDEMARRVVAHVRAKEQK